MVLLLVLVRVVVAALLIAGPWTDEATELAGWDVSRFQEIVEAPGQPWRDHEVEYPPASVGLLEAIADDDTVGTHRRLVALMFVVDVAVAAALARWRGRRSAVAWLALGTLLLPASYLRLDLLSAAVALLALEATARRRPALGATALVAGALVKVWPAVLLVVWNARRERRAVHLTLGMGLAAGLAWVAWGGPGAPTQVLGYRGATGWHVESLPGVLAGLGVPGPATLESGAFRWGDAAPWARAVLLAAFATVATAVHRRTRAAVSGPVTVHLGALVLVAALLATSPLLSPQYLCWLLPFAAVIAGEEGIRSPVVALTAVTTGITTAVLALAGPPAVDGTLAQLGLGLRNVLLVGLVIVGLARLGTDRVHAPSRGRGGVTAGSGPAASMGADPAG